MSRLFPREELVLHPTGQARLRALARIAPAPLSHRQRRAEEDRRTMDHLRGWAVELARHFDLRYKSIEAEVDGINEHYGICYDDGAIRIRLRHATTGQLLKESSLVDTLCHELAHLRHLNHGAGFRRLYRRILDHARASGIYRPGPRGGDPTSRQPSLFREAWSCGAASRP